MGNPFALKNALGKLDLALYEVISALQGEGSNVGSPANSSILERKFQTWREEVNSLTERNWEETDRKGDGACTTQEGPMFTD